MSIRNIISETQPIPINYTKSCYSFSDPSAPKNKYLFNVELKLTDGTIKKFNKLENNKYSYIIDIEDMIIYKDISNFNINVIEIPFTSQSYSMNGIIDHNSTNFTQKDENFYIEFSQNNNGNAICTCYFIGVDFNTMFVSPPN